VIDFAVKLAEKRQGTFHNKPSIIKSNKQLVEAFGGKEKKEVYKEIENSNFFITSLSLFSKV